MKHAAVYLAIFLTMFIIDMIWLRGIAVNWYQQGIGHLMTQSPNLFAAAAFYLLFPLGLMVFAVLPGDGATVLKVALTGAMFGFFAYATYDLTNLATLKAWPVGLAVLDMAWGTLVSGVASAAGKFAFNAMK